VHGAHPMYPTNCIVIAGYRSLDFNVHIATPERDNYLANVISGMVPGEDVTYLVGHNIGFDLKHILKNKMAEIGTDFIGNDNVILWDTMVVEYLINGQDTDKSLSLEETAKRHGVIFDKDESITRLFKSGKGADHADPDVLQQYLKKDIECLMPIFDKQLKLVREMGMEKLVSMRMTAQKELIFAEYAGMKLDVKVITDAIPDLTAKLEALREDLQINLTSASSTAALDLTSPTQLAKYLYGGIVTTESREPIGLYKNGKVKYGTVSNHCTVLPAVSGTYTNTDEETLRLIIGDYRVLENILEKVLEYRATNKELSVYCDSLIKHQINGFLYSSINTTVTATGRLSSSKPNLQNIKNGVLKRAFVSRWGDKGKLIEIDFAQLEIIALAILSQDNQLVEDLLKGVDIHSALYQDMYGYSPDAKQRKAFKPRTFSLVYGASAHGIASAAKITKAEAKRFIDTFYKRYPGVADWHKKLIEEPSGASILLDGRYVFKHCSPTMLRLTYKSDFPKISTPTLMWGITKLFSPTKLVNYPVQSFAADLVLTMVGVVGNMLRSIFTGEAMLVNVVHDSLVIDAKDTVAEDVAEACVLVLMNTPMYVEDALGVDLTPFTKMEVGCTIGYNWHDMGEYIP